jgi:hypothetical protein
VKIPHITARRRQSTSDQTRKFPIPYDYFAASC